MKICMFSYTECDQYYITARKVAKKLVDAGHEVTIIAVRGAYNTQISKEEYCDGYKIVRLDSSIATLMRIGLLSYISKIVLRKRLDGQDNERISIVSVAILISNALFDWAYNLFLSVDSKVVNVTHRFEKRIGIRLPRWARSTLNWHVRMFSIGLYGIFVVIRKITRVVLSGLVYLFSLLHRYVLNPILPNFLYVDYYLHAARVTKHEHFQAYHAHDLITLPVGWWCRLTRRAKLVYDMHELWLERAEKKVRPGRKYWMMRWEKFLIRRTDKTMVPGYSIAKEVAKRYKVPEPVVLLNVPEYREYTPSSLFRDDLKIPEGKKIVLYAGIINILRGIEEMVQSMKYLPDYCLVIFGPMYYSDYITKLHELIRENKVEDRVYFHGPVAFNEVSKYAMSADVGLALHKNLGLNYYYVSPNKLFEYMGAGLPVVASNFPDVKRFVEGCNFGVTCDPDNPREIADAIRYVLADNNRYEMMRQNAIKAAKEFNWENESKKLLAIYDSFVVK